MGSIELQLKPKLTYRECTYLWKRQQLDPQVQLTHWDALPKLLDAQVQPRQLKTPSVIIDNLNSRAVKVHFV